MRRIKALIFSTMLLLSITLFNGCVEQGTGFGEPTATGINNAVTGKIVMSGSTSMEDLANALGSAFKNKNAGVSVEVQVGGSSVGISNAKDGITDIGNSSRNLKPAEKSLGLKEYIIAIDGIAVVVNPANKLKALTKDQLAKIFTGQIANWKALGGDDAKIVVLGREAGSGTRDGFEELVAVKDKCKYTVELNETGLVRNKIANEKYAIGYMSLGKLDESVHAVTIDGIKPTEESVSNKTYALQRPFLCLTKGTESEVTKAFLSFILSDEGQKIVTKLGYVKVR